MSSSEGEVKECCSELLETTDGLSASGTPLLCMPRAEDDELSTATEELFSNSPPDSPVSLEDSLLEILVDSIPGIQEADDSSSIFDLTARIEIRRSTRNSVERK